MELDIVRGDITDQQVDAIVSAANSSLLGGGGVDGAIHRRAGPTLLAECRALRAGPLPDGLPAGEAVATGAGALTARWVIHTVGPVHGRGDRARLVACYRNSLAVATGLGARSIAFPLISAGAYGWPLDDAVAAAVDTIRAVAGDIATRLVLFGDAAYELAVARSG
jgi:O-acetyl-ADP-ribose deacetylase (regulator of RNase III)